MIFPNAIQIPLKDLSAIALTLCIGIGGAILFFTIKAPVPWLLGSLTAVLIASVSGVRTVLPKRLRNTGLAILGTTIGGSFKPEFANALMGWLPTLAAMMAVVAVIVPVAYFIFRHVAHWSSITALLAAIPGGFATIALIAEQSGGDVRQVSMAHTLRIVSIIMLMPILVQYLSADTIDTSRFVSNAVDETSLGSIDLAILLACTLLGPIIGKRLGLPAAAILGTLILSAAVHALGLTDANFPRWLILCVQVITGTWLGARFSGIDRIELIKMVAVSLLVTVVTLVPTLLLALIISESFDLNLLPLILAFAPGGMPEMSLIALVFDLDPMFVVGHHLVRMGILVILIPILVRKRYPKKDQPGSKS